ncbi:MAG: butyrate kinase [Alphaproteobacteria bacterium]|nr:butyrate kinase [Alphaproteobacteria bacterium]
MAAAEFIVAINPGSTSTKVGVYAGERPVFVTALRHTDRELARFEGRCILDQRDFRSADIERTLATVGAFNAKQLAAVVGRGGLLRPLPGGTYRVNAVMLDELRLAARGEHASNLGAFLAQAAAERAGVEAYVVDPVSVDEWPERARYSGLASIQRQCLSHALNTKAVSKRYAKECYKSYTTLRLIVAHLGSGFSISAHENGRMIDVTNSREEGAFSAERTGTLPIQELVRLCFSGGHSAKEVENLLFHNGGFYSYLGTRDLAEVERRIDLGDGAAAAVFDAMVYQIGKEIGAMAAVLRGTVDAVLVTGGMAHSERLVEALRASVGWIAPMRVYPGEDELQAMVEGVLRVLRGEEAARELEPIDG